MTARHGLDQSSMAPPLGEELLSYFLSLCQQIYNAGEQMQTFWVPTPTSPSTVGVSVLVYILITSYRAYIYMKWVLLLTSSKWPTCGTSSQFVGQHSHNCLVLAYGAFTRRGVAQLVERSMQQNLLYFVEQGPMKAHLFDHVTWFPGSFHRWCYY